MFMLMLTRLAMVLLVAPCLAFAQPKEALVPMRDGAQLATDLYFPSGPSNGLPVVLERTPLVVDIASASFPVYARNLNTGENSLTGKVHRKAKVVAHRSAEFPSFVEFSSVTGVGPK
jgi:predicted acyl esterase